MLLSVPVAGMAHKNHVGILNCKRDAVNCCCIDDNQYAGGLWFMDYKMGRDYLTNERELDRWFEANKGKEIFY